MPEFKAVGIRVSRSMKSSAHHIGIKSQPWSNSCMTDFNQFIFIFCGKIGDNSPFMHGAIKAELLRPGRLLG